ncbi:hypothetical protein MNBD_NITROSPINAE02-62 [hydrothermal vent metagenome]|uniref:Type II secretion system protein GspG C-terminal domain-containing protein n=1 Tax=hydrothermal vent metagenome TaxID=652676 RepID=A0A3B1BVI0_9ZZZZ
MKKLKLPLIMICVFFLIGCSGSEKKTDLAQELAAKQMVAEVKLLIKQGKPKKAALLAMKLEKKYGHTKIFTEAKAQFLRKGVSAKDQTLALTSTRLIELENALLAFRRETGDWPAPGQIFKPLDAWNNELYWVIGEPENSYDILVVSPGPDGQPGSGDEIMVVWTEEDIGGYKDKKSGKIVGKRKKSGKQKDASAKKKKKRSAPEVVTLDDLLKEERAHGVPNDKMMSLGQLNRAADRSKSAGQPKKGEIVLSLDEIKEKF